jgi:hypothetical protein
MLNITQDDRNAAADLLETKGWTKGLYAVDEDGEAVAVHSDRACAFCLIGALARVMDQDPSSVHHEAFPRTSITVWNDRMDRTRDEVVAFLRSGKDLP